MKPRNQTPEESAIEAIADTTAAAGLKHEIAMLEMQVAQLTCQVKSLTGDLQRSEAECSRLQKLHGNSNTDNSPEPHVRSSDLAAETGLSNRRNRDSLTGLYNRQYFINTLDAALAQQAFANSTTAVIYLLLDDFMEIRENRGIVPADQVLREIAGVIQSNCGDGDIASRFGEYAFAILHSNQDQERATRFADELRQAISEHTVPLNGHPVKTSVSVGISIINESTIDADGLLSRADLACEVARSSGGNQIHTHSTVLDDGAANGPDHGWDEMIKTTIEDERFYLVYQPIMKLQPDDQKCYEVLLRVIDENGQVVLPGQFLSIAGKLGLSGVIDRWVIKSAFSKLAAADISDVTLFIKLTSESLASAEFPTWIGQQLNEHKLSGNNVIFEITEAVAVSDLKSTLMFTKAARKMKFRVALEHYGLTKHPQLLKHLPVDVLKIDGSLINDLATSREHQASTQSIIGLARENRLVTVAERVDSAVNLAQLWKFGVDFVQGNFIREPGLELDYRFNDEIMHAG